MLNVINILVLISFIASFAPIVLILKVLMVQQGLDKPFTGGLGSYKLYVLVAHHVSFNQLSLNIMICLLEY